MSKNTTVWHPQQQLYRYTLPSALRQWLLYAPSMTARMRLYGGHVTVKVLQSQTSWLTQEDADYLALPARSAALLREVHMYCDDNLWLYGRTVLPHRFITGPLRRVNCLGSTPIGKLLFRLPGMRRSSFDIAPLSPNNEEYQRAIQGHAITDPTLWARRSIFTLNQSKASLVEVFLPAMLEYINKSGP